MARSFNQVTLMGNLTRDPELRNTPNGQSVCSFSLALNRSYKAADGNWTEVTDFVDIVAWGPLGERVAQYLTKGRPALVSGRLQSSSWEKDGVKRTKVEVVASDVTFLGGREGGNGLGLTLAQTFVHQHYGTIECESLPGHTCFTILLPISNGSAAHTTQDLL